MSTHTHSLETDMSGTHRRQRVLTLGFKNGAAVCLISQKNAINRNSESHDMNLSPVGTVSGRIGLTTMAGVGQLR